MSFRKKTAIKSHLVNLNDYQIIKEINRGAYGIIYLIQDNKNGRKFAAKVNLQADDSVSNELKLISREVGILMRVESPTIIRFFGFSLDDFDGNPNVTILMDYYQNGSLHQLISQKRKGTSPPEFDNTAKQIILCGIAHGMMTLHSHRILHRDLKPDNVLLDSDYHPYLTDFGISKFLDPNNSKSQSMAGCGTAAYISPEVIDDIHYSMKADVFSFGILMFEIITEEIPFSEFFPKKKANSFQIQNLIATGKRPTFKTPIKPVFKKLIERCWSHNPRERPTFREIFHKLSLSPEDDDETIESSLQDLISNGNDTDQIEYLLDDVDKNKLLDYVYEITNEDTTKDEEFQHLLEEQTKLIQSLEEQHRQEINQLKSENQHEINQLKSENQHEIEQLKSENQRNRKEIEELKSENQRNQREITLLKTKLNEVVKESTRRASANESLNTEIEAIQLKKMPDKSACPSNPLTGLTIPQMKEKIQKEKLEQITIPSTVTSIEDNAFSDCTSLTHVTIPASVTSIGTSPFIRCPNLEKIIVESENTKYVSIDDVLFTKNMLKLICCAPKARHTTYKVPPTVMSISNAAFFNCTNLVEITLSEYLTSIGIHTFYNCTSLTHITIPKFVQLIGVGAFCKCTSLRTITIPPSVKRAECASFCGCPNLDSKTRAELEKRFGKIIY